MENVTGFIDILGVTYEIVQVDASSLPDGYRGLCDSSHAKITLSNDLPSSVRRQILLHEITHAISDSLGMELTEEQVSSIGTGLASITQLSIDAD